MQKSLTPSTKSDAGNLKNSTVLIVDDNKINIDLLLTFLESSYNIRIARNGEECIKRSLVEPHPDLILLDIMMPVMDGHETIKRLKDNTITKDIPVIFLTALSEKKDIIKGFSLGAVDYLAKPFNVTELQARIRTHIELKQSREKIERQKMDVEKLNDELNARLTEQKTYIKKAKMLQKSLIQNNLPILDEFTIQALYLPSEVQGGDFFTIIKGLHEKKLIIVIGDCTGHGVLASIEASLLTSIVEKNMHTLFKNDDTSEFLREVNRDFTRVADEDRFPTVFVCSIDLESKTLVYSNANGVLPSLFRNNKIESLEPVNGIHIGYSEETLYGHRILQMEEGDRIYFYSDSVMEHGSDKIDHSGRKRFETLLLRKNGNPSSDFSGIISDLEKAAGKLPLADDTTFIQIDFEKTYRRTFEFNNLDDFEYIMKKIQAVLQSKDFTRDETAEICIGLEEMCLNSYYHGNKCDLTKSIWIGTEISFKSVKFEITDMGEGFRLCDLKDPVGNVTEIYKNSDPEVYMHGRGIAMTKLLYDSVDFNEKGNSVIIFKKKEQRNVIFLQEII